MLAKLAHIHLQQSFQALSPSGNGNFETNIILEGDNIGRKYCAAFVERSDMIPTTTRDPSFHLVCEPLQREVGQDGNILFSRDEPEESIYSSLNATEEGTKGNEQHPYQNIGTTPQHHYSFSNFDFTYL